MPKKQEITQEKIAARAFEIWEREGQPHGRDQEHWAQAEAELRDAAAVTKTAKAKSAPKAPAKTAAKAKAASTAKAKLNGAGAPLGA